LLAPRRHNQALANVPKLRPLKSFTSS